MFPSLAWFSEVVSQPFKRSQYGLFHGKMKQYGNNVPFSKHKTRRTWLPNVQRKRLFSETMGQDLRVKLTTRALRTIKKQGGIDKYLEGTRADLLGYEGMRLRLMVREKKEEGKNNARAAYWKNVTKLRGGPRLEDAVRLREKIKEELGLSELPTAEQTISYLKSKKTTA